MAEPDVLTTQDFDAWHLATPLQLLHLMKRLGMESTVLAEWLSVKPAAVSQWNRQRREIPLRYGPALRVCAQRALTQAREHTTKDVERQPTPELKAATWAEFATIWHRWTLEVLHHAGTLRKVLQQHYIVLGEVVRHDPLTHGDRALAAEITTQLLAAMDKIVALTPEPPTAEEALLARLTEAHAAAETPNPPTPES